ncbi:6-phosphogluconolactonase [Verrucomicrobiota bacterium]
MDVRVRVFKTERRLRRHAVKFLKNEFRQESENGAAKAVMLSGGSTPLAIYKSLRRGFARSAESLRLFLSDERVVSYDSPDSNTGKIQPMFNKLKLKPGQVLNVDTALDTDEAANVFHHDLAREIELGMTIPVGLLGMGADGHTAGIFTNELAADETPSYAVAVDRADGLKGVTVTPALLHRVKKIIFIVVGESKKDMLTTLLNDPLTIPAGIALQGHPDVEIWTDQQVEK